MVKNCPILAFFLYFFVPVERENVYKSTISLVNKKKGKEEKVS